MQSINDVSIQKLESAIKVAIERQNNEAVIKAERLLASIKRHKSDIQLYIDELESGYHTCNECELLVFKEDLEETRFIALNEVDTLEFDIYKEKLEWQISHEQNPDKLRALQLQLDAHISGKSQLSKNIENQRTEMQNAQNAAKKCRR